MMWPSSLASKVLTLLLVSVVVYCGVMDALLYMRIQSYAIDTFEPSENSTVETSTRESIRPSYGDVTWVPCSLNPLCHPTVKALMVDHVNHYIYGPLCAVVDVALAISDRMLFLTPNMISFFHVFIAFIGAYLLTCQYLGMRRLGIVFFQIRMFLDDLDGHVARERKHIKGERSEVGTLGFWVDGICDLFGVVAFVIGVFWYLKSNPPRLGYRGTPLASLPYHQLKEMNTSEDVEKENMIDAGISYKTKVSYQRIVQVLGLFSGQMVLSSLSWNRYIDLYQQLLEDNTKYVGKRYDIFCSRSFFMSTGLWRVVNPHSYLHFLSLAVFCDKTWVFLRAVHFVGYWAIVVAVVVSEFMLNNIQIFLSPNFDDTYRYSFYLANNTRRSM